jgi:hypothetical protein
MEIADHGRPARGGRTGRGFRPRRPESPTPGTSRFVAGRKRRPNGRAGSSRTTIEKAASMRPSGSEAESRSTIAGYAACSPGRDRSCERAPLPGKQGGLARTPRAGARGYRLRQPVRTLSQKSPVELREAPGGIDGAWPRRLSRAFPGGDRKRRWRRRPTTASTASRSLRNGTDARIVRAAPPAIPADRSGLAPGQSSTSLRRPARAGRGRAPCCARPLRPEGRCRVRG